MAPHEQLADGFKDLALKLSGAAGGSFSSSSCSRSRSALSMLMDDAADEPRGAAAASATPPSPPSPRAGEVPDADGVDVVDYERDRARRLLALCERAERETSTSLSSSFTAGVEAPSPSPGGGGGSGSGGAIRRGSRDAEQMLRRLSSGVGAVAVAGDLLESVLFAADDHDSDSDEAPSSPRRCSRCRRNDPELATLRSAVEGLKFDLRRMTQRHDDDAAEMARLRGENAELSRRSGAAEDERRRLRDAAGDMAAREDWLEGENERLRNRLEAGSSNLADAVVELQPLGPAALEDDGDGVDGEEGGDSDEDEDDRGVRDDCSAAPRSYFDRMRRKS